MQPITVVVGALATADDDGVSVSQKAAGAQYLVFNGALTDGTTANNVAQSQTPSGAGSLTLNGTLVASGVAYLGRMRRIYLTCAGNESARTFTITGTGWGAGGIYAVKETLTGPNVSVIASQKEYYTITSIAVDAATAGALTVGAAGLGTLDVARRIILTSGGNDSARTAVLTGTDWAGAPISETVTLTNASIASSVLSYKTVTSVLTSGSIATTIIVGTNALADSPWIAFEDFAAVAESALQTNVSGTANYTVRYSMDSPNRPSSPAYNNPALMSWIDSTDAGVVAATASKYSSIAATPAFLKVVLNSGTGSVTTTARQAFTGL